MNTVFVVSLAVAAVALLLTIWLLWRARRVKVAAAAKVSKKSWKWTDLRDRLRRRYAVIERAVRYVLARRDWRYRSSWLLLMGMTGDGKSSLAASIPEALLRRPQRRDARQEAYLNAAVDNTRWHFLEQGVLIDPDANLSATAQDLAVDLRWQAMLSDIDSLRPDRALDGIVWVISARRLLENNPAQLHAMARYAFMRINDVQDKFAFALPVYVVVSQCDAVQGFDAFWNAQDETLRRQIVGWSSPTINDNGLPAEWVEKTFVKLIEGMRKLVLASAAKNDEIKDVDGFFLFPQRMRGLQPPLQQFLDVVFKPNVYETRAFCRGIYFTGAPAVSTTAGGQPRGDVAFVEGLLRDKVFAEQRLAQRAQRGLLARNRLIRRLQLGVVIGALILTVALPWTAAHLRSQTQALRDTVVAVSVSSKVQGQRGCLDRDVYPLIAQVAALDTRTRYLVIPLSWVDRRINHGITDVVSTSALEQVILPSMACLLQKRIEALSVVKLLPVERDTADTAAKRARDQLTQQLSDLSALEENLARFDRIAAPGFHNEQKSLLQDFATLAEYLYGKPLPDVALREGNAVSNALVEATVAGAPAISPAMRARLTERFVGMGTQARTLLLAQVDTGRPLLVGLRDDKPPALPRLRSFNAWLDWIHGSWLLSTPGDNPCSRMGAAISPGIEDLIRNNHYDASLRKALLQFDTQTCYEPAVESLRNASLPPYGDLFVVNSTTQVLEGVSPGLESEAAGLKALADAGFMQITAPQAFSCEGQVNGWRPGTFDQVLAQLREYQLFASNQKLSVLGPPPSPDPLYDQLARAQLQLALQDSLARNQRKQLPSDSNPGLDAVSLLDHQLANESANMTAAVGPLLQALQQIQQLRLGDLAGQIGQCARNYASGTLLDVSGLASASELYAPATLTGDSDDAPLFDLGSTPVLQAYLDRQLTRVQVLSGYASPFVTLLANSRSVTNTSVNSQTDVYWSNTISELNRAVQFAETAGQVGTLNDLFLKELAPMNFGNCAAMLNAYKPPASGNDFFSLRRQAMFSQAQLACSARGKTSSDMHFYRIATLFNSEMAGRYPFGPATARDLSPATVKAFFVYYAKEKPDLATFLATAKGSEAAQMKAFITQLDAAQAFFAGSLSATPQSAPLTLDVGFRALPDDSPLSNQLIAMSLKAGSGSVTWPGSVTSLPWAFGQPVSLDLQWADRSRFTPLPDATQADLAVSGYHAVYQADGPWAVLRLIGMHRPISAAASATDPTQQLLEFQVPVMQATPAAGTDARDKARVYLTLKLSASDPTSKAPVPLTVPNFPIEAPVLW